MTLNRHEVKRYRPDLHAHSKASDGAFHPAELVKKAAQAGIDLFALTDHETMLGLNEARRASEAAGITFIPGIELNTSGHDEVHILFYFVHEGMDVLTSQLRLMNEDRETRGFQMIERLNSLGIPITMNDLDIPSGVYCNRPHLANALLRMGVVSSYSEAFDRFLGIGKPAYVERARFETLDAIALAREIGAIPVLAHPELIRKPELKSEKAVKKMVDAGLMGIEAYHSKHDSASSRKWEQAARGLGLLVTGGSDFHRPSDEHGPLGSVLGKWTTAHEDASALLEKHQNLTKDSK